MRRCRDLEYCRSTDRGNIGKASVLSTIAVRRVSLGGKCPHALSSSWQGGSNAGEIPRSRVAVGAYLRPRLYRGHSPHGGRTTGNKHTAGTLNACSKGLVPGSCRAGSAHGGRTDGSQQSCGG